MTTTGGTIDVSSGSTTTVETDDLFLAAATLSTLAADARDWSQQAAMARCITQWSGDAAPFGFAESDLTRSSAVLQDTADGAERLGLLLEEAATAYADGEARNAEVSSLVAALGALVAGGFARHMILGALPLAPTAAVALLVAQRPEVRRLAAVVGSPLLSALADHSDLLASPAFVDLVRGLVASADDVAVGLAGVDPPLAHLLGDEGAGVVGLGGMASALLILAGRNAYTATPVTLGRERAGARHRPRDARRCRLAASRRAPLDTPRSGSSASPPGPVRRHTRSTSPERVTCRPGETSRSTWPATWPGSPATTRPPTAPRSTPWTRPGSVPATGSRSSGTPRAASWPRGSRHPGPMPREALVTFGAPTGQIPIPDGVAHVAVEHAEDITPALGGAPIGGEDGRDRIVVSRGLYDGAAAARRGAHRRASHGALHRDGGARRPV